jgi:Peptidase family M23
MNRNRCQWRKYLVGLLTIGSLIWIGLPAGAAYQDTRPIQIDTNCGDGGSCGRIDQTYLYGTICGTLPPHRGIDLQAATNTDILASAVGHATDLYESVPNDQPGSGSLGNFVLVRDDRRSWDRILTFNSYVYILYAHLARDGVLVSKYEPISAGQHIAESDNTGDATGPHLHFVVCLSNNPDAKVTDLNNCHEVSRNPELWVQPYSSGGTNTGTVVGKLTDNAGNSLSNKLIKGLSKPYAYLDAYNSSLTYSYDWTHGDDIWQENWGTTDVSPGTYYPGAATGLRYCDSSGHNCQAYGDRSSYTVVAGKVTYLNLYPVALPDIGMYSGWTELFQSLIGVHNNSSTRANSEFSTYFDSVAWGMGQDSHSLPINGTNAFSPPGASWAGEAILVGSAPMKPMPTLACLSLPVLGSRRLKRCMCPTTPTPTGVGEQNSMSKTQVAR